MSTSSREEFDRIAEFAHLSGYAAQIRVIRDAFRAAQHVGNTTREDMTVSEIEALEAVLEGFINPIQELEGLLTSAETAAERGHKS